VGTSTAASALISILTDTEPVKVIGRGSGIDDAGWIAKCAAVRDARRRGWPDRYDLPRLMAVSGGADLAAMAGFIAQAAYRRTPVLIDGLAAVAAALAVQRRDPRVVRWLRAAQLSPEPAHLIGLQRLGLDPVLNLQMSAGEGLPALLAVPIVRAAALSAASLATEGRAGG
jgi:nicotinate-nucleotide--dimethylbenzimidazole phosphoribosyltransferase